MRRVLIAVRGWAWPVEVTGRLGGEPDALLAAVVGLVRAGFLTNTRVAQALAPELPMELSRNAVRAAIERGMLSIDRHGLLVAAEGYETAGPTEPRSGWVYWDPFVGELLPVLALTERPGGARVDDVVGWDTPIDAPKPRIGSVAEGLAGMMSSPTFTLLSDERSEAMGGGAVDQIVIPANARARRVRLLVPVQLLGSQTSQPNLVFRRAVLEENTLGPLPRLWPEAREILEERKNATAILGDVEAAWRKQEGERLLPLLGAEFSTLEEAAAVVSERVELAVPPAIRRGPYGNPLLLGLARNAFMETLVLPPARGSLESEDASAAVVSEYQALVAWSGVLEGLAKAMLEEVRPYLARRWSACPKSEEAQEVLADWRLDLGEQAQWLLSDLGPKRAKNLRRVLPWVNGGEDREVPRGPGANLMVQLFVQAAVVVPEYRERHVARLRLALSEDSELFSITRRLLDWRNAAVHLRQQELRALPAVDVFESSILRLWRTLSRTFPA